MRAIEIGLNPSLEKLERLGETFRSERIRWIHPVTNRLGHDMARWKPFSKPAAKDALEDEVVALFREATANQGIQVVEIDSLHAVVQKEGGKATVSFHNLRKQVEAAALPGDRRATVDRFVSNTLRPMMGRKKPQNYREMSALILPRVCSPAMGLEDRVATRTLVAGELQTLLMVDEPGFGWFVEHEDLTNWGTTFDELCNIGLGNLRERSPLGAWTKFPSAPGILVYSSSDVFASSRILLMSELMQPFPPGGVIVSLPNREMLMCIRFDSPVATTHMKQLAEAGRMFHDGEPHPISDQLFWFDGTKWELIAVRFEERRVVFSPSNRFAETLARLSRQ